MKDIQYNKTNSILDDTKQIIETAQSFAYQSINIALVKRNWLLGKRIAEEILQGDERTKYGSELIKQLSEQLTKLYGKGFTKTNLYQFMDFFRKFPEIFHSLSRKSSTTLLSWTHYRVLLQINDSHVRNWYANEALIQTWDVRTLQ